MIVGGCSRRPRICWFRPMDDGRVPCVGHTDNGVQCERNRRGLLDMVMGSRDRKQEQPKSPHYDSNRGVLVPPVQQHLDEPTNNTHLLLCWKASVTGSICTMLSQRLNACLKYSFTYTGNSTGAQADSTVQRITFISLQRMLGNG